MELTLKEREELELIHSIASNNISLKEKREIISKINNKMVI